MQVDGMMIDNDKKKMRVKGNKCPHSFGQRGRGEDGLIFEGLGGWYARRIF